MTLLLVGLVLFLGTHAFTMLRGPRARLIARVGEGPYKIGYTLLSLAGLVVLGLGYGQYRANAYLEVWSPPVWTRHLALLLVLLAFVAFAAAYLPGRIKSRLKHPMLAGVKLWATAHLLANGDLGSILVFGGFLAWAVAARISIKRRDEVKAHAGPAAAPAGWRNDALAVGIGVVAWFVFARVLHPWLIGVAVWPGQA
ncbi:MAG: NnrU family protein [Methylobacterium sp.]|uniref:NnrU family protein n=1 Tax=Methylobacterium sp. TaxID=409 RepID=UPI00258D9A7B|nr:NnrU family protein [Methylobacterium sp.]MBY0296337.1 NnrU family protein [Methylobacterium sp.]